MSKEEAYKTWEKDFNEDHYDHYGYSQIGFYAAWDMQQERYDKLLKTAQLDGAFYLEERMKAKVENDRLKELCKNTEDRLTELCKIKDAKKLYESNT